MTFFKYSVFLLFIWLNYNFNYCINLYSGSYLLYKQIAAHTADEISVSEDLKIMWFVISKTHLTCFLKCTSEDSKRLVNHCMPPDQTFDKKFSNLRWHDKNPSLTHQISRRMTYLWSSLTKPLKLFNVNLQRRLSQFITWFF